MSDRKSRADETCAWLDTLDADTKAEAIRCVLQDAYKDGLRDGQHSAWHALRLGGGYNQMIIRAASEYTSKCSRWEFFSCDGTDPCGCSVCAAVKR